jgi:hypothetical protein
MYGLEDVFSFQMTAVKMLPMSYGLRGMIYGQVHNVRKSNVDTKAYSSWGLL